MSYVELFCKTNYSFLTGASHPDELVTRAVELGYAGLAVTDEHSLAGVVRAYGAARTTHLKLIIGAEITPLDAPRVLLWATDRAAYGRLCKLLTVGRRRAEKGQCHIRFADIAEHSQELLAGVVPDLGDGDFSQNIDRVPSPRFLRGEGGRRPDEGFAEPPERPLTLALSPEAGERELELRSAVTPQDGARERKNLRLRTIYSAADYRELFGERGYLLATLYRGADDRWRLEQLQKRSRETGLPLVVAGDVLYHVPARCHCTTY